MRKLIVELKVKEEFLEMLDFLLDKTESIGLFIIGSGYAPEFKEFSPHLFS